MDDSAFMIGLFLGFWNLIFNLSISFSGREGDEGPLAMVSVVVMILGFYGQID